MSSRNAKSRKTLYSFFGKKNDEQSSKQQQEEERPSKSQRVEVGETQNVELGEIQRVGSSQFNEGYLERDPGKRLTLLNFPVNDRDVLRRKYIQYGPYQPHLEDYPRSIEGNQVRRFRFDWFGRFNWLEYSVETNKAYCFPCFLFDNNQASSSLFTSQGFNNWKRVGGQRCHFGRHIGLSTSPHNKCMQDWYNLKKTLGNIERAMNPPMMQDIQINRLRLKATIVAVKLLARQALAFRGSHESVESSYRGNFIQVLKSYGEINEEVAKVSLEEAPGNAKYISPSIQKEILNILANRVRAKIREELGVAKFCILIDEALDESSREQMAIILRFVDCAGVVRERYFNIVSVEDTCALTLKTKIDCILSFNNIQVTNMRGQGYDGASNMRGEWNGLQALFLKDCPSAYYVHCFAHRLQLCLNAASKDCQDIYLFFSMLTTIVNLVQSSSKRVSELKCAREAQLLEQLAAGELEIGTGSNQMSTLTRPGATRWSSHFGSIRSLIILFTPTATVLQNMLRNGLNNKIRGEAKGAYRALMSFDFVFNLHLMDNVMGITNALCKQLQFQSQDIINAMNLVCSTKALLAKFRENGWRTFIESVISFCENHGIDVPDLTTPYKEGTGRSCQQQNSITVEHYFHVNIFNVVIDFQLMELSSRFGEHTIELLNLSSALDPRDAFRLFDADKICTLAEKFYYEDFKADEIRLLREQLLHYEFEFSKLSQFQNMASLSELCQEFVKARKTFHLIERLIRLVLTLPVSTATTERTFSSMKLIKSRLRNKIEDDFLGDCMIIHIEREFVDGIDIDSVIDEFSALKARRVAFK